MILVSRLSAAGTALVFGAALGAVASPALLRAQTPPRPTRPAAAPAPTSAPVPLAPSPLPGDGGLSFSAPASPQQQPVPIRTEILNLDNWVVTCNEFAEGQRKRVCSALLHVVQQNTNQTVFSWMIAVEGNKQLVTVMQTPTGVAIPPGVELKVGKLAPQRVPFTSCESGRCVASMTMDNALLHEMTVVSTAEAVIQGSQGNAVAFTIQLKGFDRAFAVLSKS